jgi:hypothetical protein
LEVTGVDLHRARRKSGLEPDEEVGDVGHNEFAVNTSSFAVHHMTPASDDLQSFEDSECCQVGSLVVVAYLQGGRPKRKGRLEFPFVLS